MVSTASRRPIHLSSLDIANESFHEVRPSFADLVSKFEHNKGSFTYAVTKNTSIRAMMQTKKSMRSLNSQENAKSNMSLYSLNSINSMSFLKDFDDVDMNEENEEEEEQDECDVVPEDAGDDYTKDKYVHIDAPVKEEMDKRAKVERTALNDFKKPKTPLFASERFHDLYELGDELGSGAYAVVKVGDHKVTKKSYAIKIVEIESMEAADLEALHVEIIVMSRLNHPNIVRLYETYRESEYYYMVTEKMMGGELLDRVVQKTFYNEKEARDTCKILFQAMDYCHSHRIAHRDLKPENLLLRVRDNVEPTYSLNMDERSLMGHFSHIHTFFMEQSMDNDSDLKIADFGFAKKCPSTGLTTMCGTPGYVAPEILERVAYDTQCDLWSLGVIVYILLGGYSPFEEKTQDALFARIRAGEYTFHVEFWHTVSDNAKDLIRKLLNTNPRKRLTAQQALQHPWMTESDDVLANTDLGLTLYELKRYNAKRKFRAAVKTIIATQKLTLLFQNVM